MNLESTGKKTSQALVHDDVSMDDFDFKPITSGLGFHQPKPAELKPVFLEKIISTPVNTTTTINPKKEMNVYQNDLSLFYAASELKTTPVIPEPKAEKIIRTATKVQRLAAYLIDLSLLFGVWAIVMTVMARMVKMDLIVLWQTFPQEITPLAFTLFCGFYLMYFSIFEKAASSSLGKNLCGIKVVDNANQNQDFLMLLLRSFITLINIISLGLFSYFDLQNKVTHSKVIRVK